MAKLTQLIEYGASKSMLGGYKPSIYINGKWCYSIVRNTKTLRGAINRAKKLAEQAAEANFPKQYNDVVIQERK